MRMTLIPSSSHKSRMFNALALVLLMLAVSVPLFMGFESPTVEGRQAVAVAAPAHAPFRSLGLGGRMFKQTAAMESTLDDGLSDISLESGNDSADGPTPFTVAILGARSAIVGEEQTWKSKLIILNPDELTGELTIRYQWTVMPDNVEAGNEDSLTWTFSKAGDYFLHLHAVDTAGTEDVTDDFSAWDAKHVKVFGGPLVGVGLLNTDPPPPDPVVINQNADLSTHTYTWIAAPIGTPTGPVRLVMTLRCLSGSGGGLIDMKYVNGTGTSEFVVPAEFILSGRCVPWPTTSVVWGEMLLNFDLWHEGSHFNFSKVIGLKMCDGNGEDDADECPY